MNDLASTQWFWFVVTVAAVALIGKVWRRSVEDEARREMALHGIDREAWLRRSRRNQDRPRPTSSTRREGPPALLEPARAAEFWRTILEADPRPGRPTVGLDELGRRLDRSPDYLRAFAPAYRMVDLPKRRGGVRTLHVPDEPTKQLQRRVLRRLLSALEPHPAALGFRRGKSVVDHAQLHSGCKLLLKCDVVDFFPQTLGTRVNAFFRRLGWDDEAAGVLTKITCRDNGLPQGAPTSPALSNLVNRGLDAKLARLAERWGGFYSRYADDLCFSWREERANTARHARGVLQSARRTMRAYGYRLHGRDKTRFARSHHRQLVCGLVVNEKPALPRGTRRRLRAIRHRMETGREATMTKQQLAGWEAYASMVAAVPEEVDLRDSEDV